MNRLEALYQNQLQQEEPQEENRLDKLYVNQPTSKQEAELQSGEWTAKDSVSGALVFLEGVTLGLSDDYAIAMSSALRSLASDQSYEDIYNQTRYEYKKQIGEFKDRHGGAALGLEIAGGVVSPVNFIAPGSGVARMAVRGVAEGAVAGYGFAEDGNKAGGAIEGAMIGGVFGGALGGLGWMFNATTKQKVAQNLRADDGTFTPITLAANTEDSTESMLHTFYRDVVAPTLGGKDIIRKQENAIIDPVMNTLESKQDDLRRLHKVAAAEKAKVKSKIANALESKTDYYRDAKEAIMSASDDEVLKIVDNFQPKLGKDGEIIANSVRSLASEVDNLESGFRLKAYESSVPSMAPADEMARILSAKTANEAMALLDEAWAKHGFNSIKTQDFAFSKKAFEKLLKENIEANEQTMLAWQNASAADRNRIGSYVKNLYSKVNEGKVSGQVMADTRSLIGSLKNQSSGDNAQSVVDERMLSVIYDSLDSIIRGQLKGDALKSYEDDIARWGVQKVLRDSVKTASTNSKQAGAFTPDQWLQASGRNSSARLRKGVAPLQTEAYAIGRQTKDAEKVIKESAEKMERKLMQQKADLIAAARKKARKDALALAKKVRDEKRQLRATQHTRMEKASMEPILNAKQKQIDALDAKLAEFNQMRSTNASWFHSMAAMGILGAPVTGVLGAASLVTGGAVGRQLAKQGSQEFLAGQQNWQRAAQGLANTQIPVGTGMTAAQSAQLISQGLMGGMLTGNLSQ